MYNNFCIYANLVYFLIQKIWIYEIFVVYLQKILEDGIKYGYTCKILLFFVSHKLLIIRYRSSQGSYKVPMNFL